jgi:hypothetical protein
MSDPTREVTLDEGLMTYPATVLAASREDMLATVRENHALDPDVLEERTVFFWGAEITNNRRDSFDTRMDVETSLRNYAEDATTGVSFCDSHDHSTTAAVFGRSIAGELVQPESANPSVVAAFYTLGGLTGKHGQTTDDLVIKMRGGIIKDVSIGFKPGDGFMYRCSICGLDMLRDWDCPHIPGVTYKVPADDDSGDMIERTAIAWIVGARLSEVSAAYDGATPNAMILKARLEIAEGRMKADMHRLLTTRFRLHLPDLKTRQVGATSKGDETMADKDKPGQTTGDESTRGGGGGAAPATSGEGDFLTKVRAAITAVGINVEGGVDKIATSEQGLDLLRTEITTLRPLASDGRQYREDLVNEAIAEGVRAGVITADDDASQRAALNALPLATVKSTRAAYQQIADKRFPGKRRSADEVDKTTTGDEGDGNDEGGEGGNTAPPTGPTTRQAPEAAFERV